MSIVITGGNSSIARSVLPKLKAHREVLTAGRKDCDLLLDLDDLSTPLSLTSNVKCVIHTAAAFGGKTYDEIIATERINVLGTLAVCNAAQKAGVDHFIYISSIFASLPAESPFYSVYSISKRHSEEVLEHYCKMHKMALTILRPSQLYGDTDDFRKHQPFIYAIADKAQRNEDILINGKNDPKRNFLHIDDLTEVLARLTIQGIVGKFSCMYPEDYSFSRIAHAAIDAFKSSSSIQFQQDQQDIPDNIFVHESSVNEITGYHPSISIEEGMKRIAKNRSEQL